VINDNDRESVTRIGEKKQSRRRGASRIAAASIAEKRQRSRRGARDRAAKEAKMATNLREKQRLS
jgi:hypothetical protein